MSNDLRTASELALNPISGQRDWLRGSPSPQLITYSSFWKRGLT